MKSSSVSFDFTDKLLNFENVSPADNEIAFLMDTTIQQWSHQLRKRSVIMKQVEAISLIPAIIDRYIANKQGGAIQQAIMSHTTECREEALADRREYIDLIVNIISEFATPVCIDAICKESLEAAILAKYSSQIKSTYEAAASLFEFELMKILIDKIEEHKSYLIADYKKELYDALIKSYNTDKDLFDTYGEVFSLKRS
ncbi:hypothetical protein Tco_0443028 [Tanacetum coccineum]